MEWDNLLADGAQNTYGELKEGQMYQVEIIPRTNALLTKKGNPMLIVKTKVISKDGKGTFVDGLYFMNINDNGTPFFTDASKLRKLVSTIGKEIKTMTNKNNTPLEDLKAIAKGVVGGKLWVQVTEGSEYNGRKQWNFDTDTVSNDSADIPLHDLDFSDDKVAENEPIHSNAEQVEEDFGL